MGLEGGMNRKERGVLDQVTPAMARLTLGCCRSSRPTKCGGRQESEGGNRTPANGNRTTETENKFGTTINDRSAEPVFRPKPISDQRSSSPSEFPLYPLREFASDLADSSHWRFDSAVMGWPDAFCFSAHWR
ncbi:hypothetical protein V7x_32780 [Crateriforma conspicua]|uniref:Uncharacterized protein n=1 Tax=Crateriforma conspicua TaxID=2527996 RepID=A0A5C6FYS8_9PLAN|nr:hypothetical protein V7x_32780 [Crateriforma conspicua]